MQKTTVVTVNDLSLEIDSMINSIIEDDILEVDMEGECYLTDAYDKAEVNGVLKGLKKVKRKSIIYTGSKIYDLVKSMNIEINDNAYKFVSFLNDVYKGNKSL